METAELTRKAVEVNLSLVSREQGEFMKMAKKVLGYEGMEPTLQLNQVAIIFKKLGIEPLDSEKVSEYQKYKQREKNKNYLSVANYWSWENRHLHSYRKAVPQFALSRAIELKQALDKEGIESDFWVQELTKFERTDDPFLYVQIHDRRFYLDVWDEPQFEGRRVV